MRLIAIGRMKKGPERDLFERYAARLRPRLEMTEISESRGSAQEIRRKDAAALLSACPLTRSSSHWMKAVRLRTVSVSREWWNVGWNRGVRSASLLVARRVWMQA